MAQPPELFRQIPSVRELLERPAIQALESRYSRPMVVATINALLTELRHALQDGEMDTSLLERALQGLPDTLEQQLERETAPSLRPLVNASGIVVYTNAGRSPLSPSILADVGAVAQRYTNLEYDVEEGGRGHRDQHVEKRLCDLLATEAATVCNNAAAAVLLILNTLAEGKEAIVSRGELVEIGGSFRIPAIIEKSGAVLREVGTTNKTRASDYAEAISTETGLVLRVHPSNYRIVGFTHRPRIDELAVVASEAGVPLVHDLGSGYLVRTAHSFLAQEPTAADSLAAGSDLVCFSGDKLLGGPQAGIIVGRRKLIEQIRRNSLMRACRLDKLAYATLERTLVEYQTGRFEQTLPVWQLLSATVEDVGRRAERLKRLLESAGCSVEITDGHSLTGGGSAPQEQIPTRLLRVQKPPLSANQLEEALRRAPIPILSRIEDNRVTLDLRTVFEDEEELLVDAFKNLP